MTKEEARLERKRARVRSWQSKNREKVRAANNAWAAKNKDKRRIISRRHYEKVASDPDRVNARRAATRKWQIANPKKHSINSCLWQKRNPDKVAIREGNRRAREKAALGHYSISDIEFLLQKQHSRCACSWCKKPIARNYHVDHIVPLSAGGANDRYNLQLLCPNCNCSKGAKHPIAYAQLHGMLL